MAEPTAPGAFIPHDTAAPARTRSHGGGLNDLILLCGIVLFVASAALGVAVFLYQQFLHSESSSKLQQLERAKAAFEPALIQQLTRLDDRMHSAAALLGTHMAPSAFFNALEQATLQTISFRTLSLEAPDSQHISIKMQGVAQSVNSIALQGDLFSKNGVITSPIFANIARQQDGVHFDLSAIVNPSAVNYIAAETGQVSGQNALPNMQQQLPAQNGTQTQQGGAVQTTQQGAQTSQSSSTPTQVQSPFGGGSQ